MLIPGDYFPDDLDTTSMALTILRPDAEVVTSLLKEMLTYLNPDGTFQVKSHCLRWYCQSLQDEANKKEYSLLKD